MEMRESHIEAVAAAMYGSGWNDPDPAKRPGDKMKDVWRRYAKSAIGAHLACLGLGENGENVVIPKAALDWLNGSGPDPDGYWFGDGDQDAKAGNYWWRSRFREVCDGFRAMLEARPDA
jgi:hypothetical protein